MLVARLRHDADRLDHEGGARCGDPADRLGIHRQGLPAAARKGRMMALRWKPPRGHADIAPSQFERIENDGYLTIDAYWIVPALLRSVPIVGRVLEPAAGRGYLA
jgi:hypothetical protein